MSTASPTFQTGYRQRSSGKGPIPRGTAIECGEIEVVLRAHRDIRQAAVVPVARGDEPELVAYVVPRRGSAAAASDADLLELFRPHEAWCEQVFAPTLNRLTGAARARRLAQLMAICDVGTWKVLRRDRNLSRKQVELALSELLAPLTTGLAALARKNC